MEAAVKEVKKGKSVTETAKQFNVPRTTLSDHVNGQITNVFKVNFKGFPTKYGWHIVLWTWEHNKYISTLESSLKIKDFSNDASVTSTTTKSDVVPSTIKRQSSY